MNALARSPVALVCAAVLACGARAAEGQPDLEARLARVYEHAVASLGPEGARELQASQADWRRAADSECAAATGSATPGRPPQAGCLDDALHGRIDFLKQVGRHAGPFVLTRVERDARTPETEPKPESLAPPHDVETNLAYPQIDGAASPEAVAWNQAQAEASRAAAESGSNTDVDRDYVIGCAGDRLLSLGFTTYEFPHGMAHGTTAEQAQNWVVSPTLRPMTPGDLFAADSRWSDKLPDLVWQAYLDDGGQFASDPSFEANVRAAARKPDHWLLTPKGLKIGFSSYEAGCYACGPGPLTVRWKVLEPMLASKPAPVCRAAPDRQKG